MFLLLYMGWICMWTWHACCSACVEIREQLYAVDSLLPPYWGSGIEFRSPGLCWKHFQLLRHLIHPELHSWSFVPNIQQALLESPLRSYLLWINITTGRSPVNPATVGSFLILVICFLIFLSLVSFLSLLPREGMLQFGRNSYTIALLQFSIPS